MSSWTATLAAARITDADRSSPTPLHAIVGARIQTLIESGVLPVGARLENEIDLAERLGVSRPTMRRAMQHLVDSGLLARKPGRGTEVIAPKVRRPVELSSLFDDLSNAGRTPTTEVTSFEVVPASDLIAGALRIPPRTEVTEVRRIRYTSGEPLALMFNAIPCHVVHVGAADLERRGLYEILRGAGAVPHVANEVIGARPATAVEARSLAIKRGGALLTMSRTAWDERGRGIDYGAHVYRADRYAFELTVTSS